MMTDERFTFIVEQEGDHYHAWLMDDYPREDAGIGDTPVAAIADLCEAYLEEQSHD